MDSSELIISPTLLAEMPLHSITELHGENGLFQRLAIEIDDLPQDHQQLVNHALGVSTELHKDDSRQREPYLNHILRVAIRIASRYQVKDPEVLAAALLHDAAEDHAAELTAGQPLAALEVIANWFTPRVAQLVEGVTNPPYDTNSSKHSQYQHHASQLLLQGDPGCVLIKLSDFTDNGVGLIYTTGPRQLRMAAKYTPLIAIYRQAVARQDLPISAEVKAHILEQLDTAEARFRAILATADTHGF